MTDYLWYIHGLDVVDVVDVVDAYHGRSHRTRFSEWMGAITRVLGTR